MHRVLANGCHAVLVLPWKSKLKKCTIFPNFRNFKQELVNKIYCEVFSCGGSKYEVIENDEKSKEKTFRVIF